MPQVKRKLTPKNGDMKKNSQGVSPPGKSSLPHKKNTSQNVQPEQPIKDEKVVKQPPVKKQAPKKNVSFKMDDVQSTPSEKKTDKSKNSVHKTQSKTSSKKKSHIAKKSIPPRSTPKKGQSDKSNPKTESEKTSEKKPRAPRKRATLEGHIEKYDALLKILDEEIERKQKEREKGTRVLRSVRKTVRELRVEAPKIAHAKRRMSTNSKKVSGLELRYNISDELAEFMKIPKGSTPSRNDITNAICVYIHSHPDETRPQMVKWNHLNPKGKRNLQNPESKMTIIPDEKLEELLNYKQYKRDVKAGKVYQITTDRKTGKKEEVKVTDPALKYCVVQKLICKHILGTVSVKKDDQKEEPETDDE